MGAMWQPRTGPHGTVPYANSTSMCQHMIQPSSSHVSATSTSTVLPCKPYGCATCHPCMWCHSHDSSTLTCIHINNLSTSACQCTLPHQLYDRTACTVSCHMALYKLHSQSNFCLFGEMNKPRYLHHTTPI
jgi:hypothetical protein